MALMSYVYICGTFVRLMSWFFLLHHNVMCRYKYRELDCMSVETRTTCMGNSDWFFECYRKWVRNSHPKRH